MKRDGGQYHRNFMLRLGTLGPAALLVLSGCNFVPRSRVEEGQRVVQTLRSENDRLKDQTLVLRTKNQDLIQRAQDDARRLAIQDEALARLEKSVAAYQSERDQLANAFESFKRQARVTAVGKVSETDDWNNLPHPADDPLDVFAKNHPDWVFDRESMSLSIPSDRLFDPGSIRLKPESRAEINALGEALATVLKADTPNAIEIDAAGDTNDLHQAVFKTDSDPEAEAARRFSAASRAARVREALVGPALLDPKTVRIAPPAEEENAPATNDSRVILRLIPDGRSKAKAPAALDSRPSHDR